MAQRRRPAVINQERASKTTPQVLSVEDRLVNVLEAHAVEASALEDARGGFGITEPEKGSAPGCGGCVAPRAEGRRQCWRTRRPDQRKTSCRSG
jgi:hypothetical protein